MNNSIKNCPFCKNGIPVLSEKCPFCKMVLLERVLTNFTKAVTSQSNPIPKAKEPELKTTSSHNDESDYFNPNIETGFDKFYNFIKRRKVLILVTLLTVVFIFILTNTKIDDSQPETNYSKEIRNDLPKEKQNSDIQIEKQAQPKSTDNFLTANPPKTIKTKPEIKNYPQPTIKEIPEKYYANGNVFERNEYYHSGIGQLEIKNGTSYDAVAKLVNLVTRKSVLTVYIRRNSDLNINKIRDGNYRLYFVLGKIYDEKQSIFLKDCSFSVFEDAFNFNTFSYDVTDGVETNYSVFEVTLHPVVGGKARTNSVSKNEFMSF